MVAWSHARAAAWAATAIMVAVAAAQFYAVLRAAGSDDPPPARSLVFAVGVGVVAVVAAVVLLVRVGHLGERVPFEASYPLVDAGAADSRAGSNRRSGSEHAGAKADDAATTANRTATTSGNEPHRGTKHRHRDDYLRLHRRQR